jgi:hypothetical protein
VSRRDRRISWDKYQRSTENGPQLHPNRDWEKIEGFANLPGADTAALPYTNRPDANQRRLASIDLNRAVRDGRVVKPAKCEECGSPPAGTGKDDGLHGHHTDYNKPLEVRWLCRGCHMEKHRQYYGRMD